MPSWLAWLLPVPVATLLAALWITWQGRSRGPADPADSVRAHQRFVAALPAPMPERPLGRPRAPRTPPGPPRRRAGSGRTRSVAAGPAAPPGPNLAACRGAR